MAALPPIPDLQKMAPADRVSHLQNALLEAITRTLKGDLALFAIGVHEQTICHRIAVHLGWLWGGAVDPLSIDCEYNRDVARYKEYDFEVSGRKKGFRPDIILHQRLNGNYNLLAVESKPQRSSTKQRNEDREKVQRVVRQAPYQYNLGAFLLFLNGPKRNDGGVCIEFYNEAKGWSHPQTISEPFRDELAALSDSCKK